MKKITIITIAMLLIIPALLFGCNSNDNILSVNEVQGDPLAFTGEITIRGRVAERSYYSFGVSDADDCCATFVLVARYEWNTSIPPIGSVVRITGSWLDERTDNGFPIFGITSFIAE